MIQGLHRIVLLGLLLTTQPVGTQPQVALNLSLRAEPRIREGLRTDLELRFSSPNALPRAYAKISVSPCVPVTNGPLLWQGSLQSNEAHRIQTAITLPVPGRFEVLGAIYAFTESGELYMGKRERLWLESTKDGIRVRKDLGSQTDSTHTCKARLSTPSAKAVRVGLNSIQSLELSRDSRSVDNSQRIQFEGQKDRLVFITVKSKTFDPVAILYGPEGEMVDWNDDTDLWSARIPKSSVIALPQDGIYTVVVRPFVPGSAGQFDLTVTTR